MNNGGTCGGKTQISPSNISQTYLGHANVLLLFRGDLIASNPFFVTWDPLTHSAYFAVGMKIWQNEKEIFFWSWERRAKWQTPIFWEGLVIASLKDEMGPWSRDFLRQKLSCWIISKSLYSQKWMKIQSEFLKLVNMYVSDVSHSLSQSLIVSRLYWCDPGEWWYL